MFYELLNSVSRRARIQKARLRDEVHGLIDRAYFKEREDIGNEKRIIIFHCPVWGVDYLHMFFAYGAPSLLQEGNIPTLARDGYDLRLTIYTNPQEFQEISEQYDNRLDTLKEYMRVDLIPLDKLKKGWWRGYYWHYWTSALIDQIERCIAEDAMMFLTLPDTIFGNWSITNAVRTVQGKNVCLAAPIINISRESIQTSGAFAGLKRMERTVENDELVDLAFEHGHQSALGAFDNEDFNRTHAGVSIRKINDTTYCVIHNSPSVYLANFVKDDLKYLVGPPYSWDHRWPRLLLRQNRLKVVGSSDLFFCVDSTPDDQTVLPKEKGLLNNDKYETRRSRYLQHYVFNSFVSVWKGRGDNTRFASSEPSSAVKQLPA